MKAIFSKITNTMAPLKVAVVHPVDTNSLQGADESAKAGLIVPILVGPEAKIRQAAADAAIDISNYEIVPTDHSHAAALRAVQLVGEGRAESLMKGKIHTNEFLSPIVARESNLRTRNRMSHLFMLQDAHYPKPLYITDAAINTAPDLKTHVDIIQNAIDFFWRMEARTPDVALLAATEEVLEEMPFTLNAAILQTMGLRKQIRGGNIDGPLSLDIAISDDVAKLKGVFSTVAGHPDILVFPEIQSGNIFYKSRVKMGTAESGGVVLGAKIPIILTSRADDAAARKNSAAMALLCARGTPRPGSTP